MNEALSYGCPVVVSDSCGCVPELVQEGKTGYSFSCGDGEELQARLIDCLQHLSKSSIVSENCVELIADYSPGRSAKQIMFGIQKMIEST